MKKNKIKIDYFFEKYSSEYSSENYNVNCNKFMIVRLNTIVNLVKNNFKNKDIKILDLGCGSGEITLSLAKLGYSGDALDNSKSMLAICKKKLLNYNWNFYTAEAQETKLTDNTYDLIIASGLIEYYPNDAILMKEINRLLKRNGYLIINVSNKYGYTTCLNTLTYHFKQNFIFRFIKSRLFNLSYGVVNFHTRKHSIIKFKKMLKELNFSIEKEKYIGFTLLPSPFLTLFSFITKNIDKKLENLSNSRLKYFGTSFVVFCKKK